MQITISSGCWLCQQSLYLAHHGICSYCSSYLLTMTQCCQRCGLPAIEEKLDCARCLQHPPLWKKMIFISPYRPPLSTLIKQYKFQHRAELAPILARLLLLRWLNYRNNDSLLVKPDHIISVPLHRWRHWQRGFNQSDLLTDYLSHWLGCKNKSAILLRTAATPPQQGLKAVARRKNLAGIFMCKEPLEGKHIAIVDDIITTGSTLTEIAKVLLHQGAASLQVWALCRTLLI